MEPFQIVVTIQHMTTTECSGYALICECHCTLILALYAPTYPVESYYIYTLEWRRMKVHSESIDANHSL